MMFKSHRCRRFYLRGTATEQLSRCHGSHRTSDTHFALASDVGTRYGSIFLHDVPDKPRSGKRTQYSDFTELAGALQMVKHRRYDAARAARGCRYNDSSRSVLFAHSKSISEYQRP